MIEAIIELLAGLGVLLVGFKLLSDNIEKLATGGLKKMFNKTSGNRFVGVGIGAAATALIQSSSATTVMIVGFVNAGIMNLFQATAMIMGANIGTTITAQIAALGSLDISLYATLLAVIGIFMQMLCKKDKTKTIGLAESYKPRWSAAIQTIDYKPFKGAILITRHPQSGTIYTFTMTGSTVEINNGSGTLSKALDSFKSDQEDLDFCVNPNGNVESGTRADVRIDKGARNSAGVEVMPDDENNCMNRG